METLLGGRRVKLNSGLRLDKVKIKIMTKENDNAIAKIFEGYKGGDDMPLAGYATLFGVYNIAILVMLLNEKPRREKWLDDINLTDILLLGVATYKISRVISSDRITAPLRAPFMEYIEPDGASEVKEKVRGKGLQRAVGDLLALPVLFRLVGRRRARHGFDRQTENDPFCVQNIRRRRARRCFSARLRSFERERKIESVGELKTHLTRSWFLARETGDSIKPRA